MIRPSPDLYVLPLSREEARTLRIKGAFTCVRCRRFLVTSSTFTTGYGWTSAARKRRQCFDCCALQDERAMLREGRATLYLMTQDPGRGVLWTRSPGEVTNWPGTLRFPATVAKGAHNIARNQYRVWFNGPKGTRWAGVQYGDMTQIVHCRIVKSSAERNARRRALRAARRVPKSWPVQPLKPGQDAIERATCGACGRSWDDGFVTSMTPAPAARCPFESWH